MKLAGKITICRSQFSRGPDSVAIRVRDERSAIEFLEVSITPEAFALAITGLAHQECILQLRGLDRLGMVRENKVEVIEFSGALFTNQLTVTEAAEKALEPYEIDGWKGNPGDLRNSNRRICPGPEPSTLRYRVSFERWVEAADDPAPAKAEA